MHKRILVAGLISFLAVIAPSSVSAGLVINADMTSDAAWVAENTASAGALDAAVNSAVSTYEHLFTNNVTVNIAFQWGSFVGAGSGAAASPTLNGYYSLAQTEAYMAAHAAAHPENTVINTAVAHLPATYTNPNGSSSFLIASAEQAALTGVSTVGSDGTIAFGTSSTSGFWAAFALHEIAHIMGRVDYAFASPNPPFLTPLDFFKYDPNTTTLDPTFTITNFSYDGGATNPGGRQFSNVSDSGDWIGFPSDPYNYATNGTAVLSSADILEMNALGWDPAATPEPASMTLLATGFFAVGGFGLYRRRRKS